MMYMINAIKVRVLFSLNEKQSLCIVTMILSIFWVCYKLRGIPAGVSIEKFYMSNQVPYNLFAKWYKNTRKQIIPVLVLGALPPELEIQEIPSPILERNLAVDTWLSSHTELLILVDIRMSNGVHIS